MDSVLQQDQSIRAGEMAPQGKALAAKPDDRSSSLLDPQSGRRELTPGRCPLTSTYALLLGTNLPRK